MSNKPIQVQTKTKDKLTAPQKKFNQLMKQIDKQKKELTAWHVFMPDYQQQSAGLQPLRDELHRTQLKAVQQLDKLYDSVKLTNKQRETLQMAIVNMSLNLLNEGYDELKAIYEKHNQSNYDEDVEQEQVEAADMIREMFRKEMGVDVDIDPSKLNPNDPESVMRHLFEQMQQQQSLLDEQFKPRKKNAKQLAKEAKQQEEEAKVAKSIQGVYRQLVSALHPDREPDPAERERKTALMQQVTVAYEKQDLLKLFELQLAIEQIDQDHVNNIAEDRLKHYNKILQAQLDEIKMEIEMIQTRFRIDLDIPPFINLTREELLVELKAEEYQLKDAMAAINYDLANFEDVKFFKNWIRQMAKASQQPRFEDIFPEFPF